MSHQNPCDVRPDCLVRELLGSVVHHLSASLNGSAPTLAGANEVSLSTAQYTSISKEEALKTRLEWKK